MFAALVLAMAPFGHDHVVARDGGWCWFADPRAVWFRGRIVAGSVASDGDVTVHDYDPVAKKGADLLLAGQFEQDDHDNPAFLPLSGGRLLAFYSKHAGREIWMAESDGGAGALRFGPARALKLNVQATRMTYTYPNPQSLSAEKGRIYLFWRGMDWKPTFSWSDDQGKTWEPGRVFVQSPGTGPGVRPYMKVAGDGVRRIHFAFTDGHPRDEPTNSIYYMRYEGGAFRDAAGRVVGRLDGRPVDPKQAGLVYDGKAENVRAWIWDVTATKKGDPVIVYTRLPAEDHHVYRYAWWDGRRWVDRKIVDAGKWFPQTPPGTKELEPHYSGGVCLDPADPRFVYLSRPVGGRFEIERWFTADGGDTWSHVAVTGASKHDSVRPFVVRGDRPGQGPVVMWENASKYRHYTDYRATLQAADEDRGPWSATDPTRTMNAVWRWVRSNPSRHQPTDWTVAPLYSGVLDYAAATGDEEARSWVRAVGEANAWKLGPRKLMADDHAVGQAYLQLYAHDHDPRELAAARAMGDNVAAADHTGSLEWKDSVHDREWAWCDALYMGPPTLAMLARETGDRKYLDLAARLWQKTSDYLYDPEEHLYFRDSRYFKTREANGKKVFWSRGNGWVLAGLARVLGQVPKGDPVRPPLEAQFKAMAARVAGLQSKDGYWRSSLLDPASYPAAETSGTGFFCYALAWGVNEGLLDRAAFKPTVDRAFAAMTRAVDPNGRLAWVQPIGADPRSVSYADTDAYGVGAFLLAACQVAKM